MLWRTHFLFGASVGLLVSSGDPGSAAASAGIAGVSALLPDLDSPDSRLGRLVPVVSWLLKTTVGHRGPLHSLLAVVGVYLLALVLLPPVAPLVAGAFNGCPVWVVILAYSHSCRFENSRLTERG